MISLDVIQTVRDQAGFQQGLSNPVKGEWVFCRAASRATVGTIGHTSYFFILQQMKRGRSPRALGYFSLLFAALSLCA